MASITADTYKKADSVAQDFKSKALDKMNSAEDQMEKFGQTATKKMESLASSTLDMARDYAKTGRKYVMDNPTKGIAAAAAVGLVAGGLIAFAFRRKH